MRKQIANIITIRRILGCIQDKNQKSTASECIMAQYKKERNVWLFTSLIIIQELE